MPVCCFLNLAYASSMSVLSVALEEYVARNKDGFGFSVFAACATMFATVLHQSDPLQFVFTI